MEIVIKGLCVIAGILIVWLCIELYKKYSYNKETKHDFDEDDFVYNWEDYCDSLVCDDFPKIKTNKPKKAIKKTTKKVTKNKVRK